MESNDEGTREDRDRVEAFGLGDGDTTGGLMPLVYDELRRIAKRLMSGEGDNHTLQPTALIHEAWMRLGDERIAEFSGRQHFVRVAARAMRFVLVDHARSRLSLKRGGDHKRLDLETDDLALDVTSNQLLELHDALEELGRTDAELAELVQLRVFGGMQHAEVADALGWSQRSTERRWRLARAWLAKRLD